MQMRLLTTGLLLVCLAATSRAQTPTEYRVVRRDTSIHPVYAGFDVNMSRGRSVAYPVIAKVHADSPAARAGFKEGDELLSVDTLDLGVRSSRAWFRGPDIPAKFRVRRADTILELTIIPVKPVEPIRKP